MATSNITSTSTPPVRCYSSCPFQCRCTDNPSPHHICSMGSCSCYSRTHHLCGFHPSICKSFNGLHSSLKDSQFRTSIYRTGSPLVLKTTALASLPSDSKALEVANLEVLKRRLSSLQSQMAEISGGKRPSESSLPKEPNSEIDSFGSTGLAEAHNNDTGGDSDGASLDDCDDIKECRRSVWRWKEYNCELHLKRIVEASRTCSGFAVLEDDIHWRLTSHMHQYINSVTKGLMGDEKTHYLAVFKKDGPFKFKPLIEGTYFELLDFVSKRSRPSRDLLRALSAAEDGLIQEACTKGYNSTEIGDIRLQMVKFFQFVKKNGRPIDSYSIPFTDKEMMYQQIEDLKQSVSHGKLGLLQDVSKLVKLGCFFSLQNSAHENGGRK